MFIPTLDTIAAVATPAGEGAIAIIRISGPDAFSVVDRIFRGRRPLSSAKGFTVHHGMIVTGEGEPVDETLATVFHRPHSYTGEDTIEISCHGGIFVTSAVLAAVLAAGARQAAPGEFTRRAFLNGKMDLSRAEAVANLIASKSGRAHRVSLEQLNGRLAGAVAETRARMTDLCALLEIDLDFSDEGIDIVDREVMGRKIQALIDRIEGMAETFRSGRLYRDGVSVVVTGKPNSGKSSLFNALLKDSRAIVTPIPGTTRDYLEENVAIGGVLFRLTDTAGIRESEDPIESEGIRRSRSALEKGDIIVIVDDVSIGPTPLMELLGLMLLSANQQIIVVRNKIDKDPHRIEERSEFVIKDRTGSEIWLSALTGIGVHLLTEELVRVVGGAGIAADEAVQVTSHRHWKSLKRASENLFTALQTLQHGTTNELVAFDVREASLCLGEITGEVTSEDVLNSIFLTFCVGK